MHTVRLFQGKNAYVGRSAIHRYGSNHLKFIYLKIIFLCTGVFCGDYPVQKNQEICTIPLYYLESSTLYDTQSVYCWETDFKKFKIRGNSTPLHCDGSCFSECVVDDDGFGQFVNSSNPASSNRAFRFPNAYYHMDSRESPYVTVIAKKIIMPNEEILVDYHWHLATVLWPLQEQIDIEGHVASCSKCKEMRSLQKQYDRYVSTVGAAKALYESSAGMYQLYLSQYFSLQEPLPSSRIHNEYLLRQVNKPFPYCSGGVTQQSMIAVLRRVPPSTGGFLQIGSKLGLECWLASLYLDSPSTVSCIAVLSDLQDARTADIVGRGALHNVSTKLADSSGVPLRLPIPYTVMCIPDPSLGMTELLRATAACTLLISYDISEIQALCLIDIAALNASPVRTIITFSTVVRDHVLSKGGWPVKGLILVECLDMDVGPSRESMCYILVRGGKRCRDPPSRTGLEEMQAMQYLASQVQPEDRAVLQFNIASINTLMGQHDARATGSSDDGGSSSDSGRPRLKAWASSSAAVAAPLQPVINTVECLLNTNAPVEFFVVGKAPEHSDAPAEFSAVSAESQLFAAPPEFIEESFGFLLNEYSTVESRSHETPPIDDVSTKAAWHNGLQRLNLVEHVVAGDGNCLFRAVCHQVSLFDNSRNCLCTSNHKRISTSAHTRPLPSYILRYSATMLTTWICVSAVWTSLR